MRIVSLLPSATELICFIGLRRHLVGVSHECDYPADVIGLPRVTKTVIPHDASSIKIDTAVRTHLKTNTALYSLNTALLRSLKPDLVVTQALCEVCAVSEREIAEGIDKSQSKVVNLEPKSLQDVFDTLNLLGQETGCENEAKNAIIGLRKRLEKISERTRRYIKKEQYPRVAFLEWINPLFNAGHWTPELIEIAGGIDCLGQKYQSSTTMTWQTIVNAQPDVMFVACCGFSTQRAMQDLPSLQSYKGWCDLPCVRNKQVYFTDGNAYFNRPGPRLIDSLEIIANALHPEVHELTTGLVAASRVLN